MAVPFPRSTRALRGDGFAYPLAALGVAVVLLAAWSYWFLNASVVSWEDSDQARLVDGERVEARFPAAALRRISRGQQGRFFVDAQALDELESEGVLPPEGLALRVTSVGRPQDAAAGDGVNVVLAVALARQGPRVFNARLPGRVRIAVERHSPAELALRAAGAGPAAPR